MQSKKTRYPIELGLFLIAYYSCNAIYQGYISLYYQSLSFTSTQIGLISATVAALSIFGQLVWGTVGDRSKSRNNLLRLLALLASVSMGCILLHGSFVYVFFIALLFAFFFTSIQPMGDSIILARLNETNQPFGPIRRTAGLVFGIVNITAGTILNNGLAPAWIIYSIVFLCLLIIPATFVLPETPGYQSGGHSISFRELLRDRELVRLCVFMLMNMITLGYFYTFFSPHFVTLTHGNHELLGWCYFISAMSEVYFLSNADRFFEKYGSGKLMCVSSLLLSARWLILAITGNAYVAMASQLLHGGTFIVMTVSTSKYVAKTVPKELQASGQMLLSTVSFGLARFFGNLGGGVLADAFGRQNVFYLMSGIAALTFLIFAPIYLKRGKKP